MYPNFLILLISILILYGCKESQTHVIVNKEHAGNIVKSSEMQVNIDADFHLFIERFSKDSLFQISRIDFPLKVQEYDVLNDSDVVKFISKHEYRKLDFTRRNTKGDIDKWEQSIQIKDNQATIEISGIENGIMIDFYFEKKGGKWLLIEWVDRST